MERLSQSAANFLRQLAELTYRLAAKDIVISSLDADWSSFGCWELMAQRGADAELYRKGLLGADPLRAIGPQVVRIFWDGRDCILTVESSPTRFCSAPNEWKPEYAEGFKTADSAMQYAEDYLIKKLGDSR